MRRLTAIAGLTLAGGALAATTCFTAIPNLEDGPGASGDAAAGGGPDAGGDGGGAAGGSAGAGGSTGGFDAGGAVPSYRDVVMDDDPAGYWRLGETDGGTAYDEVLDDPGPNDGIYTNVVLGVDGAIAGDPTNTAARFDDTSTLNMGDVFDIVGYTQFSLEGWFRRTQGDGFARRLLSREVPLGEVNPSGYGLHSSVDGLTFFRKRDGVADELSGEPLPAGHFTHVVATYDESLMRLYVNGYEVGDGLPSTTYVANNWGDFGVGVPRSTVEHSNYRFVGDVDELAMYESVLGADQVLEHYQAGTR